MKNASLKEEILAFAMEQFSTTPEYLWMKTPDYAVLRHSGNNRKWYGLVMDVPKKLLGLPGSGKADIINLKCDPLMIGSLLESDGVLPAYHMNRENWISVLLDGSVDIETLKFLLGTSFELTEKKAAAKKTRLNREWLIPANPKYYDIQKAFSESEIHTWKQSSNVIPGDIIYIYLAAPYSAIYCRCIALETDIPASYDDGNIRMKRMMKLKLLHIFQQDELSRDRLMDLGVYSVRGPRSVPPELHREIAAICPGMDEEKAFSE